MVCFFVSDLHGFVDQYLKLFLAIRKEHPRAVFMGGDLFPSTGLAMSTQNFDAKDFIWGFLAKHLLKIRKELKDKYPQIFIILGNDDGWLAESDMLMANARGLWEYVHNRKAMLEAYPVFGYSFVPPTPFLLKDWEKYDISRFVDVGSVSPEEGLRSYTVEDIFLITSTIKKDLDLLTENENLEKAIFLFHAPPYKTNLDRAALDGKKKDHVPLDVHVGSIAIHRLIESRQPLLTLHGHIHESAELSGSWRDCLGKTHMFSAAHHGPELALVRFDPKYLNQATRELV